MAIAYDNSAEGTTSVTLTVAAGATICVWVRGNNVAATGFTIADTNTVGRAFQPRVSYGVNGNTDHPVFITGVCAQLYVALNATAGSHTITPTAVGGGTVSFTAAVTYTGADDIDASHAAVASTGNFALVATGANSNVMGPIATWTPGAMLVGIFSDTSGTPVFTVGTGFTSRFNPGTANASMIEEKLMSSAGTSTATVGTAASHNVMGVVFALAPSGTALPTTGLRQIAEFAQLDGNVNFVAHASTVFDFDTLAGSTLVIFGAVANTAGTVAQAAQNTGGGSPRATGDATNGIYTQRQNFNTPAPGVKNWSIFTKDNCAAVTAGTGFTVNFNAADDFRGIIIMEFCAANAAGYINSANGNQTSVVSGTDNISCTAAMGSSPAYIMGWARSNNLGDVANPGTARTAKYCGHQMDNSQTEMFLTVNTISNPGTVGALFSSTGTDDYTSIGLGILAATTGVPVAWLTA